MVWFAYKKDYQVATGICLSKGGIYIFAGSVSILDKTEHGRIKKDTFHFVLRDMMFSEKFFYNIRQPDKVVKMHVV